MSKNDRLWDRYWGIRDNHKTGYAMPIIWHLSFQRDPLAMTELGSTFDKPGSLTNPFSQAGLAYRAFRRGHLTAAQHLAMNAFNGRDLHGYRYWLARAAKLGNVDAARELKRFELRLPHTNAALIGRKRPYRPSDFA
ncbi:hypothetical protein [Sphingobium yanoikuyae]|uniref:hypothetical protein n=1 Tax=Sphingobium yanoikuyae TaxID=13690 RepID=UPI0022DD352A|nr:hypothetical protein [Sphingobium yanoikuyae]WBQ16596.1 hypothetical protein PAE53_22345 [Sphingobium yanoikuyae]